MSSTREIKIPAGAVYPVQPWMLANIGLGASQPCFGCAQHGMSGSLGTVLEDAVTSQQWANVLPQKPYYDTLSKRARELYDSLSSRVDARLQDVMMRVSAGSVAPQDYEESMKSLWAAGIATPGDVLTQDQQMSKLKLASDQASAIQLAKSGALANAATLSPFQVGLLANASGLALTQVQAITGQGTQALPPMIGSGDYDIIQEAEARQRKQQELDQALADARSMTKWVYAAGFVALAVIAYNYGKAKR